MIRLDKSRLQLIMFTITLLFLLLLLSSCKPANVEKEKFQEYVNTIKNARLQELFKNYDLMPVRGSYVVFFPDTGLAFLKVDKEYHYTISDDRLSKGSDRSIIPLMLEHCKKLHIFGFSTDVSNKLFKVYFDLRRVRTESLPVYVSTKKQKNEEEFTWGVLLYGYDSTIQQTTVFDFYHPTTIDTSWYYYQDEILEEHLPSFLREN